MRSTARSVNNWQTIQQNHHMPVVGSCCHYVWAAFHLQRNLLITSKILFMKDHLVMRLIVKIDLIGHSKMDLVLSLLVGLNSRYVKGPLLGYTFITHSNCYLELQSLGCEPLCNSCYWWMIDFHFGWRWNSEMSTDTWIHIYVHTYT
jgi:hypothetical protein